MQRQVRMAMACFLVATTPAIAMEPLPLIGSHNARPQASLLIELVRWSCSWNNKGTVSVDGEIKNISTFTVSKVAARIVVTDEDGQSIGDGDKVVDRAPFTPEAVASFKGQIALTARAKRPRSCSIDFVDQDGTYLRWREAARP